MEAALMFQQPNTIVIVAVVTTVIFTILSIAKVKVLARFQFVSSIIAFVGIFASVISLLMASRQEFVDAFNKYTASFMNTARAAGYEYTSRFTFGKTLMAMAWPAWATIFCAQSASFAGEIRKVGRSHLTGTTGAVVISAVPMLILIQLCSRTIGMEFLGALAYLPEGLNGVTPYFHFLNLFVTTNPVLWILILIGWICWSFDRILPAGLSKVNDKTHTPVNAVLVTMRWPPRSRIWTTASLIFMYHPLNRISTWRRN